MPVNKIPGTDLPQRLGPAEQRKVLAFQCPKCDAKPDLWCLPEKAEWRHGLLHKERVALMIDAEKAAFQERLAQKRYGLTLTEDERACLKHILAGAVAERATGAEALYEKVREL